MSSTTTETGEFTMYGLSVGHGCDDCERLTIAGAAIHTAGASYELVARIMAGGTHESERHAPADCEGREGVSILAEDIPAVIAELQRIYDVVKDATTFPPGWPIHD